VTAGYAGEEACRRVGQQGVGALCVRWAAQVAGGGAGHAHRRAGDAARELGRGGARGRLGREEGRARARWAGPTARATRGWGGLLNAAQSRLAARRSDGGEPGVGEGEKRAGPAEAERRELVWFSLFYFLFFSLSTSFQT
jgi:hypothetical protein